MKKITPIFLFILFYSCDTSQNHEKPKQDKSFIQVDINDSIFDFKAKLKGDSIKELKLKKIKPFLIVLFIL